MSKSVWQIDPAHTDVEFAVRHMMISTVRGRFGELTGTIELDDSDLSGSSVEVEIDVASIDTRQAERDEHLRSADFFDVENHPKLTFKSRRVEGLGDGRYRIVGDLTMRGETREVVLEGTEEGRGTDPWGNQKAGFSARTSIDRRDFGLTYNTALETGGILVGNEIEITLDVQAAKVEPAEAGN